MEAPRKPSSDADRERAEKFYEQSLLLVDCCKIPEAIRLLEQAIKLNPDCELYKETLAFFQISSQYYPDYLQTGQQRSSYANAARPKPKLNHGKEHTSFIERNTKSSGNNENLHKTAWSPAAVSVTCHNDSSEQSSIINPWASFVSRNSKRKKSQILGSPIDGISEIEIPSGSDMYYEQNLNIGSKESYMYCDRSDEAVTTPVTCIGSKQTMPQDEIPAKHAQENSNSLTDDVYCKKPDFLEECDEDTKAHENLDARFLDEVCNARESAIDDWTKYYDVLHRGLKEEDSCEPSDVLLHNAPTNRDFCNTLDEISDSEDFKYRHHLTKDGSQSDKIDVTCSKNICTKCGLLQADGNHPASRPRKNRIHFVNGVCVSSSASPNCTCSKESKCCSEERSTNSSLSPSQEEFYRNLRHYFAGGNVKRDKTPVEVETESISPKKSDSHQKSASYSANNMSSNPEANGLLFPNQGVTESTCTSTGNETKVNRKSSTGHIGTEVKDDSICSESRKKNPAFNAGEIKTDQRSSDDGRFQPTGNQTKGRAHDKAQRRRKLPTKNEHGKNSKEGVSQGDHSQRGKPTRTKDKTRAYPNMKIEENSRPEPSLRETREKPKQEHRAEKKSAAEIDFNAVFISLYHSGSTVVSTFFQAFKSIMYYIVLLLVVIVGFVLYCAWYTSAWLIMKVLHYTTLDRLFSALRSRMSALFDWIRRRRETQRTTSSQGRTYDLPENGDAAIRHMLQNEESDPYSVLGVPSDATDDDIRKQYRKLAVLIHPDKNPHTQADEAFKILANAFDILSDPDKRRDYDRETAWKRRDEETRGSSSHPGSPEQFFADLGRKMKEMQNYLHCNECDGKHRRYSTDRFILTARFCGRCNTRHAAKEGDLWAESSFLGYKLHFYACMEGEIYDVTEWAACQGLGNYRLEPNPHTVHLKLKTRQSQSSGFNSRLEEEEFENFMRAFFGQFNPKDDRYHGSNKQHKPRKRKKRR